MNIERSFEPIAKNDLKDLYIGSVKRLREYFIAGGGSKWLRLYDIEQPIVVALCQGAAMHYYDMTNGVKDFDIWFFYPYNQKHLPYRTCWIWYYNNPKFSSHTSISGCNSKRVEVFIRSIKHYSLSDPVLTIHKYLENENTRTAKELAKKAVVLLFPKAFLGRVIWYKQKM